MPKSAAYQQEILGLLLNGVGISGVADNTATAPLADLYVALHTVDPGPSGDQTTGEVSYTGYARVAISRSSVSPAWTISGDAPAVASLNNLVAFGSMTGGTGGVVSHFSIGSAQTGAGEIFYYGTISPTITVTNGVIPQLAAGSAVTEN